MTGSKCMAHGFVRCPMCSRTAPGGLTLDAGPVAEAVTEESPDETPLASVLPRQELLAEASRLITGDRNQTHGEPDENFRTIANYWNLQLDHKLKDGEVITASDVAVSMILLKVARMSAKPTKDHWLDTAGYAACGYEVALKDGELEK